MSMIVSNGLVIVTPVEWVMVAELEQLVADNDTQLWQFHRRPSPDSDEIGRQCCWWTHAVDLASFHIPLMAARYDNSGHHDRWFDRHCCDQNLRRRLRKISHWISNPPMRVERGIVWVLCSCICVWTNKKNWDTRQDLKLWAVAKKFVYINKSA